MHTDHPPGTASFAPPARRRGFITAMHKIAAERPQDQPVRVYFTVPPFHARRDSWQRRLELLQERLPDGVEILYYANTFDPEGDYRTQWEALAPTLDGLVVSGLRPNRKPHQDHRHDLGPYAREELISVVGAGKPVLLHSWEYGLIPVVDCQPERRNTARGKPLRLTIPDGWDPAAPTLAAALEALTPRTVENPFTPPGNRLPAFPQPPRRPVAQQRRSARRPGPALPVFSHGKPSSGR